MLYTTLKHFVDRCVSFVAIVILSPLILGVAVAIIVDSKGSPFFKQERLGLKGKVFKIVKFRSMRTDLNFKTDETLSTDPRITKVGRFIRKTSLDEIPQLINILKGEMSFIGPRPPLPHYPRKYNEYTDFDRQRFNVKPGISGLAAIRQREEHDWDKNIPLDVEYAEKISAKLDFQLFMTSLFAFFKTDNIYTK